MSEEVQQPKSDTERAERWLAWLKAHQRQLTIAGAAIVLAAAGVWFTITARQRREAFAQRELTQARMAAEAGNLALAANDLSRLVNAYGGSLAAEEASLLLAQVRLLQGEPELAAADLQELAAAGPRPAFRLETFSLLGAAHEQSGRFLEAGEAYLRAAEGDGYELVRSGLFLSAGRAFVAAGDSSRAIAALQRVLTDFEDAPAAPEARLRLAELRRFDIEG